jgi:hypothetical protein
MNAAYNIPLPAMPASVMGSSGINNSVQKIFEDKSFPFVAVMMATDEHALVKELVSKYWSALHHMSGEDCLLFLPYAPPANLGAKAKEFWAEVAGKDNLEAAMKAEVDPAESYSWARKFEIAYTDLPCIYITALWEKSQDGSIMKLPLPSAREPQATWDTTSLMDILEGLFTCVHRCKDFSPGERMKALRQETRFLVETTYLKDYWKEYIKPKELVKNTLASILGSIVKLIGSAVPA